MPANCIAVALVENANGMATWCLEASHALKEQGLAVVLVARRGISLPENLPFDIIWFQSNTDSGSAPGWRGKIGAELRRLSARPSDLLREIHEFLKIKGFEPSAFLLNGTHLQNPSVGIPQYVVAWAYPVTIMGYVSKVGKIARLRSARELIRTTFDAVGWWRRDWRAYRAATGVMAVTEKLRRALSERGVPACLVYPGIAMNAQHAHRERPTVELISACLNLEEPRKRIKWMLDALGQSKNTSHHLTLIGEASERFRAWAAKVVPGTTLTGRLSRDETLEAMGRSDVFLMGSCLDDWGYVVVEALSRGLLVIAPNQTPFDEIIGDERFLYASDSAENLVKKVQGLERMNLSSAKQSCASRAARLFSRQQFGRSLRETLYE